MKRGPNVVLTERVYIYDMVEIFVSSLITIGGRAYGSSFQQQCRE
jgi:hypothetical protein